MRRVLCWAILLAGWAATASAADRFVAYNNTSTTDFDGLYMAPAGTGQWGPNQVLSDKDKVLDHGERLRLSGITRGQYDVKVTFGPGRSCIRRGVDLTADLSFDLRDDDLTGCR